MKETIYWQNRGEFMTLDEAIEYEKESLQHCKRMLEEIYEDNLENKILKFEVKQHEHLAEWLEELKMYKSLAPRELVSEKQKNDRAIEYNKGFDYGFKTGYNKAIDDFANGISEYLGVENATKYGNRNAEQQRISYDTLMKYEIADAIDDIAEQLKEGIAHD